MFRLWPVATALGPKAIPPQLVWDEAGEGLNWRSLSDGWESCRIMDTRRWPVYKSSVEAENDAVPLM